MIVLCVPVIRWTSCGYSADFSSCRPTFVRGNSSRSCTSCGPLCIFAQSHRLCGLVSILSSHDRPAVSCLGFTVRYRTDCPGRASVFVLYVCNNKYWNWCRCIQRKDSAGVILTASWFNNINIGYRFHTSTVCHSCCNNVMYISKENLDISGSAWKKISCWHGIPAGTDCPSTEIVYTGRELCSPHASISSQIAARFWHIIYDIYWYLHYISMIVINVYNN